MNKNGSDLSGSYSGHYPIERRPGELERLYLQGAAMAPDTEVMLNRIEVGEGWSCLDHRKNFPGAGKSTSSIWLECAGTLSRHDRPVWGDPDFPIDPDPSRPEECRPRKEYRR